MGNVSVLVVSRNNLFREALCELLRRAEGLECCGAVSALPEAFAVAPIISPDVALIGQRLTNVTDLQAARDMRGLVPGLRTVVMTSYLNEPNMTAFLLTGASAVILMQVAGPRNVAEVISRVARGESLIPPEAVSRTAQVLRDIAPDASATEREILALVARGALDEDVARAVGIDREVVRATVARLLRRIQT